MARRSIFNIAKDTIKRDDRIKTLSAKGKKPLKKDGVTRLAEAYRARQGRLTQKEIKNAENLENLVDQKYGRSRQKGVSLDRLLAAIPKKRQDNAIRDKVTIVSLKRGSTGNTLLSKSLTYEKKAGGRVDIRPHKHIIRQLPNKDETGKEKISKAKRVSFWCDCPDFNYTWEYALTTRWGASQIRNEGAEDFPVLKNPSLLLGGCKHCFVLLKYIKQRNL